MLWSFFGGHFEGQEMTEKTLVNATSKDVRLKLSSSSAYQLFKPDPEIPKPDDYAAVSNNRITLTNGEFDILDIEKSIKLPPIVPGVMYMVERSDLLGWLVAKRTDVLILGKKYTMQDIEGVEYDVYGCLYNAFTTS